MIETICEGDGLSVHNQLRDFLYTGWRTIKQFSWLAFLATPLAIPKHIPWPILTDPHSEVKFRIEVKALEPLKRPEPNDLI